jgi:hypothetical protein
MKINIFTHSILESSFDLGGLEFYGNRGNFTHQQYRSQDMQMVFISIVNFSFSMRTNKEKYVMSSGITALYRVKSGRFMVNNILIEKIDYLGLLKSISNAINLAIELLIECGTNKQDAIMRDLFSEKGSLAISAASVTPKAAIQRSLRWIQ